MFILGAPQSGAAHSILRWSAGLALIILAFGAAVPPVAAPPPGQVEGVAKHALQRSLSGLKLRLEAPGGRVLGEATTGSDDRFVFTGVAPGVYSAIAAKEGGGGEPCRRRRGDRRYHARKRRAAIGRLSTPGFIRERRL
jgi:hypothetical protein